MAKGGSFTAFGAHANVSRETLYQWTREYPEFAEAKACGELKSLEHYEGIGYGGITGQLPRFNATAWIFTMKCRFKKYGYVQEQANGVNDDDDGNMVDEISRLPTEGLLKLIKG